MKSFLFFFINLFSIITAHAQHPWLIKDVNPTGTQNGSVGANNSTLSTGGNSATLRCQSLNSCAVFPANGGVHGGEI